MDNTAYTLTARKIPDEVRDKKLLSESDPIHNAIATPSDKIMLMLAKVWYEFIEPKTERNYDCSKCLANILSNYKELYPTFIQLNLEHQMLNAI